MISQKIRSVLSLYLLALMILLLASCGGGNGPTSIPDSSYVQPPTGTLVWSEEFDGNALDTTTWNYDLGASGWGNNEWQEYTNDPANLKVENGNLSITAKCDLSVTGSCGSQDGSITSARINTNNKFTFQYGTLQARVKAPPGQGMWAAFWMLGSNFNTDGWPLCGEVDIMEIFDGASTSDKVHTVLHWDNGGHVFEGASKQYPVPMSDAFHIYELEWNENQITGRVDGQFIFSRVIDPNTMSEFLNDFFLILNVAVGGDLGAVPVTDQAWSHEMLVDWIRLYSDTTPIPPPAGSTAGIYSETYPNTIPYSQIINSADWSGNITIPDDTSMDVTPADGIYVLSADYQLGITDWGGIALALNGADMTGYSTLAFSLDSSAIATYDDLKVEIEDSSATKSSIQLSSYIPTTSANWSQYEIPLSDFGGANLSSVNYLGFYSPVDVTDALVAGLLYFDNIYLDQGCVGSGEVLFKSAAYAQNATSTSVNVSDACSASSTVAINVDNDNGIDSISVDVDLDTSGNGTSVVNFGTTDDLTDTIAILSGESLTATYTDSNNNIVTDSALIEGDAPRTLVGDIPVADGFIFVYATNAATVIDLVENTDYVKTNWDSGAVHDMAFADTVYDPVIAITPGNGWSPTVFAGAIAFSQLTPGFASNYSTLHFKFKGNYSSVLVKLANGVPGPEQENEYSLSSANVENLGNGWYDFSIRLVDFPDLAAYTEFAILNFGTNTFYLTDIYFD